MTEKRSPEEEYFFKQNKELIEQNRARLDAERKERSVKEQKAQHWMKCPKCGGQMQEIDMASLKVDKCGSCKGLYFDNGELEVLLKSNKPEGFLDSLKKKLF
jgi:hypothetical protein